MGWASWNNFRVHISVDTIEQQAKALVDQGLNKYGYTYLNIDDGFFNGRNSAGDLVIDKVKFPNGFSPVVEYIHRLGLKAGIYSDGGKNTCGSIYDKQEGGINVGLYGYEQHDLSWHMFQNNFDYIKIDWCGGRVLNLDEEAEYTKIYNTAEQLNKKDWRMNLCRWQFPGTWAIDKYGSWRISGDITNTWTSVTDIIDKNTYLAPYCSPGHYNDMDMLEVGRGLKTNEDRSHFTMWCIMSSPLVLGNDLRKLDHTTKEILTNREIIALNQDTAGLQAELLTDAKNPLQVWFKPLKNRYSTERAVVLLNRAEKDTVIEFSFANILLNNEVTLRDLWKHKDLGKFKNKASFKVPAHGCIALKAVGQKNIAPVSYEAEYAFIHNLMRTKNTKLIEEKEGRAVHAFDKNASGKQVVAWLGNNADNWIEFRHVLVPKKGTYQLNIYCKSPDNRIISVMTNKAAIKTIDHVNTSGSINYQSYKILTRLEKGENTIRLFNNTGWLPDIDKIEIR